MQVCLVDLEHSPGAILEAIPCPESFQRTRWLLELLRDGQPIRINCAGEEYHDASGTVWGRDSFYARGGRYRRSNDIAGTNDAPLYQSARRFSHAALKLGYRIPLPPGRYRITLHFAELIHTNPEVRRFDILIEGGGKRRDFKPGAVGFATAQTLRFDNTDVTDGILDIDFVAVSDNPEISAIEIEQVE